MAGKPSPFWVKHRPILQKLAEEDGLNDEQIVASNLIPGKGLSAIMAARQRFGIRSGSHTAEARAAANAQPGEIPARPDPTSAEIARLETVNRRLADDLSHLQQKLTAAQRDAALFLSLADVVRETVTPLPPAKPIVVPRRDGSTPVDGVLLLSDEHADQVISAAGTWGLEEYDFDIFRCRLHRLVQTITSYVTVHLPAHHFERLWVFKLGDSVQGDIHGSGPRNHFGNTLKAAIATGDAEAQAIQSLARHFPGGVHVVSVSGNHPRRSNRKDYGGPHDNFDYLVTTQIATRLAGEIAAGRVSVHAPEAWSAYVDVRGKLWCLNHGDDVKGFAGHPWYGFSRKNGRVQALVARADQRVRYFCYGHFHTSVEMQEADAESLHAGNWSLTDSFAQNALALGSEPVQPFYAVDDERGIILKVPIYVRDPQAEQRFREGEWQPSFGERSIIGTVTPERSGFPVVRAGAA